MLFVVNPESPLLCVCLLSPRGPVPPIQLSSLNICFYFHCNLIIFLNDLNDLFQFQKTAGDLVEREFKVPLDAGMQEKKHENDPPSEMGDSQPTVGPLVTLAPPLPLRSVAGRPRPPPSSFLPNGGNSGSPLPVQAVSSFGRVSSAQWEAAPPCGLPFSYTENYVFNLPPAKLSTRVLSKGGGMRKMNHHEVLFDRSFHPPKLSGGFSSDRSWQLPAGSNMNHQQTCTTFSGGMGDGVGHV